MRFTPKNIEERSMPEPNSGCWLWLNRLNDCGYGLFSLNKHHKVHAHRASWIAHRGTIPVGLSVLHKCDVRCCVNPDHLFLGTHVDNMRDMVKKGRAARQQGEESPCSILTEGQIIAILGDVRPVKLIAVQYGIATWTIYDIRRGRTWRTPRVDAARRKLAGNPAQHVSESLKGVVLHAQQHGEDEWKNLSGPLSEKFRARA